MIIEGSGLKVGFFALTTIGGIIMGGHPQFCCAYRRFRN